MKVTRFLAKQDTVVSGWAEINTPTARVEAFGGHMMFWEQSERFNQILDEYLSKLHKRSQEIPIIRFLERSSTAR